MYNNNNIHTPGADQVQDAYDTALRTRYSELLRDLPIHLIAWMREPLCPSHLPQDVPVTITYYGCKPTQDEGPVFKYLVVTPAWDEMNHSLIHGDWYHVSTRTGDPLLLRTDRLYPDLDTGTYPDPEYPQVLWGLRRLVGMFGWVGISVALVGLVCSATPVATSWFGTLTGETVGGDALLLGGVFLLYLVSDTFWIWGYGLWRLWRTRHDGQALRQHGSLWIAMLVSLLIVSWVIVSLLHVILLLS